MKSTSESASAVKNAAVRPPDCIQAPSKLRRTSPLRVDKASSPALTGRRAPQDRCTAALHRTPVLCGDASMPARSDPNQDFPNTWFLVAMLDGDARAAIVTR